MPTESISRLSSFPARPTNGSPCSSSSAPGASPTKTSSAFGLPVPKTISLRWFDSLQRRQSPRSARIRSRESSCGATVGSSNRPGERAGPREPGTPSDPGGGAKRFTGFGSGWRRSTFHGSRTGRCVGFLNHLFQRSGRGILACHRPSTIDEVNLHVAIKLNPGLEFRRKASFMTGSLSAILRLRREYDSPRPACSSARVPEAFRSERRE